MGNNKQRNSQIANQMRALDVATKFENLKICERNNGRRLRRFSFVTAAEKQLKQQKHCKKHCLVVGLEKVVFREGNCQGRRELPARAVLLVFKKIYSGLFIPNCTRNHVIT